MPVDDSIPLSIDNSLIGPDPRKTNALADMYYKAQAVQKQQQSQNALKQIFSDPSSIDKTTGTPTPNALLKVMQVDPEMGLKMHGAVLQQQEVQAKQQQAGLARMETIQGLVDPVRTAAITAFHDALDKGMAPAAAQDVATKVLNEGLDPLRTGGQLHPEEIGKLPTRYDDATFTANSSAWQAHQEKQKADKLAQARVDQGDRRLDIADKRADAQDRRTDALIAQGQNKPDPSDNKWQVLTDPEHKDADGNTVPAKQYRYNPVTAQATDLKGQSYDPTGAGKLGSGGGTPGGGRSQVYFSRVAAAGNEAAQAAKNIMELPITSSRGFFGGRTQGEGLLAAGKETLTNAMTTQEVQDYNTMVAGVTRNLAAIEASGLSPAGSLVHNMDSVVLKEGDTNMTKLRKMAEIRQIVEKGLEPNLSSPSISSEQKDLIKKINSDMATAIPFTQHDITQLQQSKNPKANIADFAKKSGLSADSGIPHVNSADDYAKVKSGGQYVDPDGNTRTKGK